jgi:hypothetical protein
MTGFDRSAGDVHAKARALASESIDETLSPEDAAWLGAHLARCEECSAVATEYRSIHDELRGLAAPEPPRDLWARTAAGLDAVDAARSRSGRARTAPARGAGAWSLFTGPRLALARAAAAGLTAAVASLALLTGGFGGFGGGPAASGSAPASGAPGELPPVAVVGGNSYWVAPSGGVYQITSSSAECSDPGKPCAVSNDGGTVMTSVTSKSAVSVAVAPDAGQAAVWTADKVVILPLGSNAPKTVSIDLLTPRPTVAPSPSPTPTPTLTPEPSGSPEATPESTETPVVTPSPTPSPTKGPEVAPEPVAILDGYRVVGRAPEFSPDGEWVAFSARPAAAAAGADVFVWRSGWEQAVQVTDTHAGLFAGWFGGRILISDFVSTPAAEPSADLTSDDTPTPDASPTPEVTPGPPGPPLAVSYLYDPVSDLASMIRRSMMLPSVDPTGRYIVYWSGTVVFNSSTGLWEAGKGDLYFDAWSNFRLAAIESGLPSAASLVDQGAVRGQILPVGTGPGTVQRWVVRWDALGGNVAVWVGDPGTADAGQVTLFRVDVSAGRLDTANALLSAAARSNVAFDDSGFVYTSPSGTDKDQTYIVPVPGPTPTATPSPTPSPTPTPEPTPSSEMPSASVGLSGAQAGI